MRQDDFYGFGWCKNLLVNTEVKNGMIFQASLSICISDPERENNLLHIDEGGLILPHRVEAHHLKRVVEMS